MPGHVDPVYNSRPAVVMASEDQENAPLSPKCDDDPIPDPSGAISRYYTLPKTRYRNVVEAVLAIDAVISLALWVSGMYNLFRSTGT